MLRVSGAIALIFGASVLLTTQAPGKVTVHPKQIDEGRQLFDYHCSTCHGPGIGNPGNEFRPGTDALRSKYGQSMPALLSERTDLTPETVAYFVRNGVSIMAPYRKTEISDQQLAAIGAYLSRRRR